MPLRRGACGAESSGQPFEKAENCRRFLRVPVSSFLTLPGRRLRIAPTWLGLLRAGASLAPDMVNGGFIPSRTNRDSCPGCSAARPFPLLGLSPTQRCGALLIRDRHRCLAGNDACGGPGSAVHHDADGAGAANRPTLMVPAVCVVLRCARDTSIHVNTCADWY